MDPTEKWNELEREKRFGVDPIHDPTFLQPQNVVRVRKEYLARDMMNSRQWDFFVATPPTATSSEHIQRQLNPVYMDMNPIPSRTSIQNYTQEMQFYPDLIHKAPKKSGIDEPIKIPTLSPGLINNPYLQRLDPVNDARNIPREMRAAIYEDNRERDIDSTRNLSERQFTHIYIPEPDTKRLAVLLA